MPLVHLFLSFFKANDSSRKIHVGNTRDVLPAWLVIAALQAMGFGMGQVLLNYPPPPGKERNLLEISRSGMHPGHFVLTPTRPPISDEHMGERKTVPKGFTSLEQDIDSIWKLYFSVLSRGCVALQPWLRPMMKTGFESRREVQFMQNKNSDYKQLNTCDGQIHRKVRGIGRTAAFLVNQPALWRGGPGYLGFFGMDAASTLVWAYLLRHRHSDLLTRPGFHMVELTTMPIPARVPDLSWALDWKSEVILSVPPAKLPPPTTTSGPKKVSGDSPHGSKAGDDRPRI